MKVDLAVNGRKTTTEIEPLTLLIDLLRNRLPQIGTHIGCGTGGACTAAMRNA